MNGELYLRPVFQPVGDPRNPVQRIDRVEVIDADENVVGVLSVTGATIDAEPNAPSRLTLSTYRYFL